MKENKMNISVSAFAIYKTVTILLVIGALEMASHNLFNWFDTPRKIQFFWVATELVLTFYKIVNFHALKDVEENSRHKVELLSSVLMGALQMVVLLSIQAPASMVIFNFLLLGILDGIQFNKISLLERKYAVARFCGRIVIYVVMGCCGLLAVGEKILYWDSNYMFFSHLLLLIYCSCTYMIFVCRIPKWIDVKLDQVLEVFRLK